MQRAIIDLLVTSAPFLLALAVVAAVSRGTRRGWIGAALLLIIGHDLLLTRLWRTVPLPTFGDWNWTGKTLALAGILLVAALPAFGWRASGITLRQAPGARSGWIVCALSCAFFLALALAFADWVPDDAETIAFQWTMPGLQEEAFYRGLLFLALDRALPARRRLLSIDMGWSLPLTALLFGGIHGLGWGRDGLSWEPLLFVTTGTAGLLLGWLRVRTGSLAAPVLGHNFGNGISTLM